MKKYLTYLSILIFTWCYSIVYIDADWDFWARIAVGKSFFETGHVLMDDFLSYTPTKHPWVDHEWGSGVVFYYLASNFGDVGLILFKVLSIFLIIFLIIRIIQLQNNKSNNHLSILFFMLVYLGMFTNLYASVRCHFFTFLFFTLWIYVLERIRRGENRLLWILPATSVIWANLHGGFVAGLGLIGMYAVGEFLNQKAYKKYLLILIPTVLITLINPYGFEYWKFIAEAATMARPTISEWFSPFYDTFVWKNFFYYKLFLVIGLVSVIYDLVQNKFDIKKIDKTKYIVLFVCTYLSVKHIKHQSFYVITAAAFLYHNFYAFISFLQGLFGEKVKAFLEKTSIIKDWVIYVLVLTLGTVFIINKPMEIKVSNEERYPADCVEFIKINKIKGNLFSLFHWGSYIAWKLYPQNLIAIDGRYEEVYTNEVFDDAYNTLGNKENWYKFLDKYHTDIIIMPHSAFKSNNALVFDKNWIPVFRGERANVFVRKGILEKEYLHPERDKNYYTKTKYETGISFK